MATAEKQMTVASLKRFAKSEKSVQLALEYVALKDKAQKLRERIQPIYQQIFDQFEFYNDEDGSRITDPDWVFLSGDDEQSQKYYDACADKIEEMGFNVKRGYCPALMAENTLIGKENEILEHFSQYLKLDHVPYKMEDRDKMLELFLGVVLNAKG